MRVEGVDWGADDDRVDHVARHHIRPEEVEDVLFSTHRQTRGRDNTLLCYGQTRVGRYLLIVVAPRPGGVAFVVTARDMTPQERRTYGR